MIKPTVGRIVWYWPRRSNGFETDQPLAAIVTYVHDDHLINLSAFSPAGFPMARTSVYLAQEGVQHPFQDNFAQWMPYQVGQAKKHDTEKVSS